MNQPVIPEVSDVTTQARDSFADSSTSTIELAAIAAGRYELRLQLRHPAQITDDCLHVFLHGQAKRDKYTPPVFYRRNSSRHLDALCLFLSDPVLLYTPACSIGWHLLGDDLLWPYLHSLLHNLLAVHDLRAIVWHGSSAGAYAAIRNTLRWPGPSLALAVAPQNDPTHFGYWHEYAPYADLPHTAAPEPLDQLLTTTPPSAASSIYITVNNRDRYHLTDHIKPLLPHSDRRDNISITLLHNNFGHERISETDYWTHYRRARTLWRR